MEYRFELGQDLYEHNENKKVFVTKRYPLKKDKIPVYRVKFLDTMLEQNIREHHLYTNPDIYPDARFRVDEIVYYISNKSPVKIKKYIIKEIYYDEYAKDILYKCVDDDSNVKLFFGHQLYCYPFSYVLR
jgi:hypothetical protein